MSELGRMSRVDFDRVCDDNMTELYNRGMGNFGETGHGTPVSTDATRPGGPHGELRMSLSKEGYGRNAVVGYTKDYAPHVEFGHRTVNGGYVEGQRFLEDNVAQQQPIFDRDLRNAIRGR